MRRNSGTLILVGALGAGGALGCSSSEHTPSLASGIGGRSDGGPGAGGSRGDSGRSFGGTKSRDAGPGGQPNGGAAESPEAASSDAAVPPPEAGCAVHPEIVPPADVGTSICSTSAAWSPGTVVESGAAGDERLLGSVTADELTVAWISLANGVPALHYADRPSANDRFPQGDPIFPGKGYYAAEPPAVSPDGLRIVVVRSDRKAFGEYTRTMRFTAFTEDPSEGAFAPINELGILLPESAYLGDPLISSDDRTFYYSQYDGLSQQTVFAATRTQDVPWMLGSTVEGAPLRASCDLRRRPTGISMDQLTLFYWDELSGTERATFRATVNAPFVGAIDLGARASAQPNGSCARLYYSASAADSAALEDIVFSSR